MIMKQLKWDKKNVAVSDSVTFYIGISIIKDFEKFAGTPFVSSFFWESLL